MEFDIQKAADHILDQTNSQYLRAIELFCASRGVHFGESRVKVSASGLALLPNKNNLVINVSEEARRQNDRRDESLDQIETDWRAENEGQEPRWIRWPS